MKLEDRLYGSLEIDNPLIIELINSKPVQRLKGITQSGYVIFSILHILIQNSTLQGKSMP